MNPPSRRCTALNVDELRQGVENRRQIATRGKLPGYSVRLQSERARHAAYRVVVGHGDRPASARSHDQFVQRVCKQRKRIPAAGVIENAQHDIVVKMEPCLLGRP